jgi:hypothetical protein
MNWEALGAIGEIVGAVAVVVTLGYLAVQIRQNTRSVRASTNHALTEQRNQINFRLASDPSLAELALRGAQNRDDLEISQRYRHRLLMRAVFGSFEDNYVQYREGVCDTESWELAKVVHHPVIVSPGVRAWWEHDRMIFRADFRSEIDAMLAAPQSGDADRP